MKKKKERVNISNPPLPPPPHTSYLSFFYTTAILGVEILHLKVRKFATKVALRQNSVNSNHELCENFDTYVELQVKSHIV